MKVFACILAFVAVANAGILFGGDYPKNYGGNYGGGYGGGLRNGRQNAETIIKVIHENSAPAVQYSSAPTIVKVIHEEDHHHHHHHAEAVPHIVRVIHQEQNNFAQVPVIQPVNVVYEQAYDGANLVGNGGGYSYGAPDAHAVVSVIEHEPYISTLAKTK